MARPQDDPEERLLASRELGKANRAILAVRNFYIANAMIAGLVLGLVLLAEDAGPLPIAVAAAIFAVALAGIRGVRSEPFLWTLGAAAVWTLLVVNMVAGMALQMADGTWRRPSIWFFLACAWVLGCWTMVPTTRRVRELLRKHPDLRIARKMRGSGKRR